MYIRSCPNQDAFVNNYIHFYPKVNTIREKTAFKIQVKFHDAATVRILSCRLLSDILFPFPCMSFFTRKMRILGRFQAEI